MKAKIHSLGQANGKQIKNSIGGVSKTVLTTIAIVLLTLTVNISQGQDLIGNDEYRVTAYKQGDNQIQSTSNVIEVEKSFTLYVPNAFTPNGDGLNETFGPVGNEVKHFSMRIYSRWGELVFESDALDNQWDGTFKGEKVQTDTYVYKIFATGEESGSFEKSGKVTVII
ncbi:MAG TPA: gliding motility-associated C-terminal domain-containing protein [Flavobacteriales bacterium]|nr:gliding motility-associated C-terminal domain-containing protein [Flavobacteriales bacterium]HIA11525.1 gliding motility-associated C-terminal domain-containing protein [Flavobacteriales bacterium]